MTPEPIDSETALELYLAEKEPEYSKATVDSNRSRLGFFRRWCDERGIENLNELTGRRPHEYRLWRRNVGELAKVSLKTQMDTLRVFVRWLEAVDGVEQDLHLKVRSPNVTPDENMRDVNHAVVSPSTASGADNYRFFRMKGDYVEKVYNQGEKSVAAILDR